MITKIPIKVADRKCTFNDITPINVKFTADKKLITEQIKDKNLNRIITRTKYVPVDNAVSMSKYKVSDFALENLIAIGTNLQPCKLSTSSFASISNIQQQLSQVVDKVVDNVNADV